MGDQVRTIRVGCYSKVELPVQGDLACSFELSGAAGSHRHGGAYDFVVLDIQAFQNLGDLKNTYITLALPAVIIVDTVEQETSILAWLETGDEICRRDAVAEQLVLRIRVDSVTRNRCLRQTPIH
ncbi:MAG TPA: hypothetical protein VE398_13755 [Acidobacteriota bacterium]|nr:hypothetical protein [Acidobacteriota bacterium]